ncbi:hypothetical protein [Streptomyces sp. NL15-2K]|uniref:hypothetical protein n=1 Tax=Streptomyces sp. NL15-2K TaxID=376149 RepID=UPI000F57B020|nr:MULTISPECIES: hypothetical protein [Actinomycetes]WKX15195.1 hypothetical protein Q4V64_49955 [Kutzneria buriramensis]GCB52309.1 hypothetical protein SNL152K_9665 [Streptomyces sp. NL15-2K]
MSPSSVVVVGAGMAGPATAWFLQEADVVSGAEQAVQRKLDAIAAALPDVSRGEQMRSKA